MSLEQIVTTHTQSPTVTPKGAVVLVAIFPNIFVCPPAPKGETTKMVIHTQEVECSVVPQYQTPGDCFCGFFFSFY